MKKMVLVVLFLSIVGVFMSCKPRDSAQTAAAGKSNSDTLRDSGKPAVAEKSNSDTSSDSAKPVFFVIDSASVPGDLEDNVRLYNKTSRTGITFKVYLRDPQSNKWLEYGTGHLKEPGDTEYVKSKLSGDLEKYRYFAIQAQDGKKYTYSFSKSHDDLYIYIYD